MLIFYISWRDFNRLNIIEVWNTHFLRNFYVKVFKILKNYRRFDIRFLSHFLLFGYLKIRISERLTLINFVHWLIWIKKFSIKRFCHLSEVLSLFYVFLIPFWKKVIHFLSTLLVWFKFPLRIQNEVLNIKIITDFSQ